MTTAKHRALDHLRHRQMADARHEDIASDLRSDGGAHVVPDFIDALDAAAPGRHRRRPAAPDLHRLPSGAVNRGARRADAQAARAASPRTRSRAPTSCPSPPSPSASCAPSARCAEAKVPFEVPHGEAADASAWARCSRSSTSSSTRATPPPAAATGCGPRSATKRCAWAACWPSWRPSQAEVLGLLALMEIQASRTAARTDAKGDPVLLAGQDRCPLGPPADPPRPGRARRAPRRWASPRAATACRRRLPPATRGRRARTIPTGRASPRSTRSSCAWRRRRWWSSTARSPWRMAEGPAAGLAIVETLLQDRALQRYHWLPACRATCWRELGRSDEARGRSSGRRRWPATPGSGPSCRSGRRRCASGSDRPVDAGPHPPRLRCGRIVPMNGGCIFTKRMLAENKWCCYGSKP